MQNQHGTLGFFVAAMATFRLTYGAWPPFEGNFVEWILSDSKAQRAMLAGVIVGMLGMAIGRAFGRGLD
jgi:cytochrome b